MEDDMREEYDFTDATPNPHVRRLRQPVTIRLDVNTIAYFKRQAEATGIPYQTLINLYLADCAQNDRKPALTWS
ncbi:MAG: BrnA antitoxin family protein [Bifidobacteriaceae bacterium]|jgi:predicted DNA binding CopG/RHH family protein|nr:BrnA antitoxin family protein [Bifidobacteriaceae bacterium]